MSTLPEGWQTKPLKEFLDVSYGKALTKQDRQPGSVGVWSSAGRTGDHHVGLVDEPVIVVGRKGAAGRVFVTDGPSWVIDTAYYVRVPQGHNLKFFAHQLEAARLGQLDQSTAIPSLSRDDLYRVELKVPPLEEQDRIVGHIERLSASIDVGSVALERALRQLPLYARSAMAEDLAGPAEKAVLADVTELSSGGTPSRQRADEYYGGEIPWVKIRDLTEGAVSATEESLTQKGLGESAARMLPAGTVLLAMYGASIGRTGILAMPATTNQAICAMQPDPGRLNRDFLLYYLQFCKPTFVAAGYGGAQPNISQRYLKEFPIPVPPLAEQERIVSRLKAAMSASEVLERTLSKCASDASKLKVSVQHQALGGQMLSDMPPEMTGTGDHVATGSTS